MTEQSTTANDMARVLQDKLIGKFRASVVDNNDPDNLGRLRLKVPTVYKQETSDWIQGAFPLGGNAKEALMMIPANGSHVLVEFIEGALNSPIWTATYFPQRTTPVKPHETFDGDQGGLHLLRTRKGIVVRLEDDGEDKQVIAVTHPGGGELRIDTDGLITIKDQGKAQVTLDPDTKVVSIKGHADGELKIEKTATTLSHGSTKIELSAAGVTVTGTKVALDGDSVTLGKGAASPVLDAQAFAGLFDAHVNPPNAISPTPLGPLLAAMSLKKVKGA
ncbi:phage baseplate assembly protein V [Falsihalocynthiibacter arcticus]|uniref:Gp5/Type VI secretion system Vgr protein OB-fold domain-containing protein n=1 Tax=Falsihalocynthiibacter arcticus TaxID=1579316 RepID=A0A126V0S0_9RHOB|nr:phage baseplate assembly protein V [Falsihalocynthiibacter arcticus]AML51922.1 hypothetical protein RC74_12175 [Falsihalocynthiibacter arcticus]